MKKINKKKLIILIIAIIILVVLLRCYFKIINKYRNDRIFALASEKKAEEVNNPIFKVEKIMIYSGANVEDLSENKNLSNINVSQFTDFAIYINNNVKYSKLCAENTINKIYIDKIGVTAFPDNLGSLKFANKSIDDLGKYISIKDSFKDIKYDVIHTNEEKEKNKNNNIFYTDCSEPLTFSCVNENIVKSADASGFGEKLSLDGSILKYLNVKLENLNYKINFNINIENNLGEKYYCNCCINVDLGSGDSNRNLFWLYNANI